jgi:hypothetical protein
LNAISKAWGKVSPTQTTQSVDKEAYRKQEAGFAVDGTPGKYSVGDIQTGKTEGWNIIPPDDNLPLAATFHTHPWGTFGLPSTPSNTAGRKSNGDTGTAINQKADVYVISENGLSRAPANGDRNPHYLKDDPHWIIRGGGFEDWFKKLQIQCTK